MSFYIIFAIIKLLAAIILFGLLVVIFIWLIESKKSKVPFIGISKKTLREILLALDLQPESVIYDLGSGDGRVLIYLAKNFKEARYIGIENNKFAKFVADLNLFKNGRNVRKKVHIIGEDFFETNLSEATHLFLYLGNEMMERLLPKLEKELKPGTILVSAAFPFQKKKEEKYIQVGKDFFGLKQDLYVYKF